MLNLINFTKNYKFKISIQKLKNFLFLSLILGNKNRRVILRKNF